MVRRLFCNIGRNRTVQTDELKLLEKLIDVIEQDVIPLTERGVAEGNKVFGAALLRKSDLSLVLAETNNETENPLWHGEVHTLKRFYEMPENGRQTRRIWSFFPPTSLVRCVFQPSLGAVSTISTISSAMKIHEMLFNSARFEDSQRSLHAGARWVQSR